MDFDSNFLMSIGRHFTWSGAIVGILMIRNF